ncbi:hypothetical protein H0H92_002422 [Tricholoma furcatifolium]|nr:hypothetical protein H0H92_002422 [Tricholoma furcatifolium]
MHAFRTLLPLEIEDAIFELTARIYPTFAPTLSIVSKRVQERVEEPPGYVHGPDMAYAKRILPTLESRPAEFFAKAVRNLFIAENVPLPIRELALSKCTGVRHLAILEHSEPIFGGKLMTSTPSVLSSLYVAQSILTEVATQGIEFPNVTFLGILFFPEERVPSLHWLPALRTVHISLQCFGADKTNDPWQWDLSTILSTTAQLETFWIDVHWYYAHKAKSVQNYIHEKDIGSHVEIRIRYCKHQLSPFAFLWRWRRRITECDNMGCKPTGPPISELYI